MLIRRGQLRTEGRFLLPVFNVRMKLHVTIGLKVANGIWEDPGAYTSAQTHLNIESDAHRDANENLKNSLVSCKNLAHVTSNATTSTRLIPLEHPTKALSRVNRVSYGRPARRH
ncbi:hypothetical protein EVAR_57948_1 [Eumeta japonica]|uniref:Uncharacterized protein n=1 Tax=Eumeta variegata TaxID=151549 RepID=A0A4C1Y0P5_EUMVA|nr:hypothetical protein EVAR_57948_1 [Eumeta japonica]